MSSKPVVLFAKPYPCTVSPSHSLYFFLPPAPDKKQQSSCMSGALEIKIEKKKSLPNYMTFRHRLDHQEICLMLLAPKYPELCISQQQQPKKYIYPKITNKAPYEK